MKVGYLGGFDLALAPQMRVHVRWKLKLEIEQKNKQIRRRNQVQFDTA
jgi:hypothetical protein